MTITLQTSDRVTTLTISRPEKRNAITQAMYAEMADALDAYAADPDVRAFVFTGAEEYYTSGNDIADFAMGSRAEEVPPVIRFLHTVSSCPKPLVAAVNGPAIGVGVTMLLHCDVSIASETATFSTPFAQLGLVPEAGSSLLLPEVVGMAVASDMLMAGRVLTATEACSHGLVSRVTSAAELADVANEVAMTLANSAPQAMRLTKELLRQDHPKMRARMDQESELFAKCLASPEFAEVVAAKMQKRVPNFS